MKLKLQQFTSKDTFHIHFLFWTMRNEELEILEKEKQIYLTKITFLKLGDMKLFFYIPTESPMSSKLKYKAPQIGLQNSAKFL